MKKTLSLIIAILTVFAALTMCSCGKNDYSGVSARVLALSGPTGMGLAKLMDDAEQNTAALDYTFSIVSAPAEITAEVIAGRFEIAAVPINLAATLYNKGADISLLAVNTLGVLYAVEKGNEVNDIYDLAGKTIYATGKGATPEYMINYILKAAGILDEVNIIYLSDGAEVAANVIAEKDGVSIGILPEPAVTSALMRDQNVRVALDISKEWDKISETPVVQGVIIASNTFISEHGDAVEKFLEEYRASVEYVNKNTSESAALIAKYGVLASAAAERAIPNCNIVFVVGEDAKRMTEDMLKVLFDANPQSVGGKLPSEDFYYVK